MKNLKTLIASLALAFSAGATHAVTLNTTAAGDGVLQNFTGIDWHANGAALISGFDLTGANAAGNTDVFTLNYQGFATSISTTSPHPNLRVATPGPNIGTYELTAVSTIQEQATCVNNGCSTITLALAGASTFDIYIDFTPDADPVNGTGFTGDDSILIISGQWLTSTGNFTSNADGTGSGSAVLTGLVTFTNNTYINPDLLGSRLSSLLDFPGSTDFTRPPLVNGIETGPNTPSQFVIQADASQTFSPVPEPASIALLGVGLLGFVASRRKSMKGNNA